MITECICPDCGRVCDDYYEDCEALAYAEDDLIYVDHKIRCNCGCEFIYIEWFKLTDTEIEKI